MLEISCLGSSLAEYDTNSWRIAREYDSKIIRDIELGHKTWESLNKSIDPTAWTFAREIVPPKAKKDLDKPMGKSQKLCTTWNSFKQNGCHYESNNQGETCVYQHACSKCKAKGLIRKHKAWQCDEVETVSKSPSSNASKSTVVTTGTTVPTSV